MKIFALDSSDSSAFSICIVDNNNTLFKKSFNIKFTENFFDVIKSIPQQYIHNIDFFTANNGPGSYTGLRSGIAALKGMAMGFGKKLLCQNSFKLHAYNFFKKNTSDVKEIDIILQSYNKNFFYHQKVNYLFQEITKPCKISADCANQYQLSAGNASCCKKKLEASALDLASLTFYEISKNIYTQYSEIIYITN